MSLPVRLGIIGTGVMAREVAVTTQACGFARLTAIASRQPERAKALARELKGPISGLSYEALIERNDIDAVYVANENAAHVGVSLLVMQSGKAVLCEKPIGVSFSDVTRIVAAARRHNVLLMEAISTPFLPAVSSAIAEIGAARLGSARFFSASFGYRETCHESPSLFKPEAGVLLDRMIYLVTLAILIHGSARSVSVSLTQKAEIDLSAALQIEHCSGGTSQLSASLDCVLANDAWIGFDHAAIRIEEPLLKAELTRERAHLMRAAKTNRGRGRLGEFALMRLLNFERRHFKRKHRPFGRFHLEGMLAHFVGLVSTGALESPVLSFDTMLEAHRILDLARHSVGPGGAN